jgi:hypothetical protein
MANPPRHCFMQKDGDRAGQKQIADPGSCCRGALERAHPTIMLRTQLRQLAIRRQLGVDASTGQSPAHMSPQNSRPTTFVRSTRQSQGAIPPTPATRFRLDFAACAIALAETSPGWMATPAPVLIGCAAHHSALESAADNMRDLCQECNIRVVTAICRCWRDIAGY